MSCGRILMGMSTVVAAIALTGESALEQDEKAPEHAKQERNLNPKRKG